MYESKHRLAAKICANTISASVSARGAGGVGLVFIWRSFADLPFGTIDNPGPAVMPFVLACLLVICALWTMLRGAPDVSEGETDNGSAANSAGVRHAVVVIASIATAALAFGFLGYRLTILCLLLFFLGMVERKPLIVVLLIELRPVVRKPRSACPRVEGAAAERTVGALTAPA